MRNRILRLHSLVRNPFLFAFLFLCFFVASNVAQDLPSKIRGYKVHKSKISIQTIDQASSSESKKRVLLDSLQVEIAEVSILKTVWEVTNDFTVFGQSGEIDFISFENFEINGNRVEIEEYRNSFSFRKSEKLSLAKPIRISIGNLSGLKTASLEIVDSKEKWRVKGRLFVFGKFKKSFFKFKRVIPIDIDLEIQNPLKSKKKNS